MFGPPIYWEGHLFCSMFVRPSVRTPIPSLFSQRPSVEFFWNFAWSCNFGQVRKRHSRILKQISLVSPKGSYGVKDTRKMLRNGKKGFLVHIHNFWSIRLIFPKLSQNIFNCDNCSFMNWITFRVKKSSFESQGNFRAPNAPKCLLWQKLLFDI